MNVFFYTGTMGSGKSKKLIEKFREDKTKKIALSAGFKPTMHKGTISSRCGFSIEATCIYRHDTLGISSYIDVLINQGYKSFYIDEVQFLDVGTIMRIFETICGKDINVYFYGLSTDFTGKVFDPIKCILKFVPSENIITFKMTCQTEGCENEAVFNARIQDGKVIKEGKTFVEDKSEYKSLCERCYHSI